MSSASFVFLSPALPSELLTYILNHHVHPTTLFVCSSRLDFLASLADDVRQETPPDPAPEAMIPLPVDQHETMDPQPSVPAPAPVVRDGNHNQEFGQHRLLSSPLYQVATSRHIRVVYFPTVTHLRAYLSVFSPDDSRIPTPPTNFEVLGRYPPSIILYGFLDLHRDTSEWSAQGLGNSASAVVELGHRLSWHVVTIEPRRLDSESAFQDTLKESIPFLSGGGRRLGPDSDEGGWTGRTVEVGRVLKRWFRFQCGPWDASHDEHKDEDEDEMVDDRAKRIR
ncbi:hypothetical protein GGR54DRAFT_140894 [Hypoxylon sp. NC1633]|nr:hypothetical protein GGR54DRAFT_140894 [Hypoxylon sp. NC1633]